jgi:hypothetical protein
MASSKQQLAILTLFTGVACSLFQMMSAIFFSIEGAEAVYASLKYKLSGLKTNRFKDSFINYNASKAQRCCFNI